MLPTTSASALPSTAGAAPSTRPARWPGWLGRLAASSRAEVLGAWAIWAGMSLAALGFVATYALATPHRDEWSWVPIVTGAEPVTLPWLWAQHNEHRMVLPRLIYVGLGALTGTDFRAGSFFSVTALTILAAALMLAARALRGRTRLWDAFFSLALLHWGQGENLPWGFQLGFVTAAVLAGLVLVEVARCGERLRIRSALWVTACLVGLGLCGTFGLAYLPAMTCWIALAGAVRWRDRDAHARRDAAVLLVLAALPVALVGAYFVGYQRPEHHEAWPNLGALLRTSLQFLSCGFGPAAEEIWPVSGAVVGAACATLAWQALRVVCHQPEKRVAAAGFLCFLGGMLSLALGIGWGRSFFGPDAGFARRYVTLAAPLVCLVYLQCGAFAPRSTRLPVQRVLFIVMFLLVLVNARKGLRSAAHLNQWVATLEADARAGVPPEILAVRYGELLGPAPAKFYATQLERLREARLGPYRNWPKAGGSHAGSFY